MYIYGGVPLFPEAVAVPSLPPKQFTSVDVIPPTKAAAGCVTVSEVEVIGQPLASVITQVYAPANKLIAGLVV